MCFLDRVYKTFIISTIVDCSNYQYLSGEVYKTFIISTIVDSGSCRGFRARL